MQLICGPLMYASCQLYSEHEFCNLCHHFCTAWWLSQYKNDTINQRKQELFWRCSAAHVEGKYSLRRLQKLDQVAMIPYKMVNVFFILQVYRNVMKQERQPYLLNIRQEQHHSVCITNVNGGQFIHGSEWVSSTDHQKRRHVAAVGWVHCHFQRMYQHIWLHIQSNPVLKVIQHQYIIIPSRVWCVIMKFSCSFHKNSMQKWSR